MEYMGRRQGNRTEPEQEKSVCGIIHRVSPRFYQNVLIGRQTKVIFVIVLFLILPYLFLSLPLAVHVDINGWGLFYDSLSARVHLIFLRFNDVD